MWAIGGILRVDLLLDVLAANISFPPWNQTNPVNSDFKPLSCEKIVPMSVRRSRSRLLLRQVAQVLRSALAFLNGPEAVVESPEELVCGPLGKRDRLAGAEIFGILLAGVMEAGSFRKPHSESFCFSIWSLIPSRSLTHLPSGAMATASFATRMAASSCFRCRRSLTFSYATCCFISPSKSP